MFGPKNEVPYKYYFKEMLIAIPSGKLYLGRYNLKFFIFISEHLLTSSDFGSKVICN